MMLNNWLLGLRPGQKMHTTEIEARWHEGEPSHETLRKWMTLRMGLVVASEAPAWAVAVAGGLPIHFAFLR